MRLIPWQVTWQVTAGLGIALALSGMGNYALWQRAKAAAATAQPLRDAARDAAALATTARAALRVCENEKKAMREANGKALAQSQREREAAEASAEAYRRLLANPPAECRDQLALQLCPALRGY